LRDLELALKAAGDPTRTRILKLLEGGGLCVCQVQAVLDLAPSTTSRHLSILENAGLVEARRDGKWVIYALAEGARNAHARQVLSLLRASLDREPAVLADRRRLRDVRAVPMSELCSLPAARLAVSLPGARNAAGARSRKGTRERRRD